MTMREQVPTHGGAAAAAGESCSNDSIHILLSVRQEYVWTLTKDQMKAILLVSLHYIHLIFHIRLYESSCSREQK